MPAIVSLVKTPAASIPNAAAGKVNQFVDTADSIQKTKDEGGVVRLSSPQVATDLQSASEVTELDSDADPTAVGQVMALSSVGPPHNAGFKDPRVALVSTTTQQLNPAITADLNPAAIDELVRVDLVTAAADVTVTLPAVDASQKDREIWVKIIGIAGAFKVTVAANISLQIDGLANGDPDLDLTTDRQWMKLRGTGSGWLIVG